MAKAHEEPQSSLALTEVHMVADRGSWAQLARMYPGTGCTGADENTPITHAKQTVQVGGVRWRACVDVGVTNEGLHLLIPSRGLLSDGLGLSNKPPIFMPWMEFSGVEKATLYMLPGYRLLIHNPVAATLIVCAQLYADIYPHLPGTKQA